jgi:hypothetical protein
MPATPYSAFASSQLSFVYRASGYEDADFGQRACGFCGGHWERWKRYRGGWDLGGAVAVAADDDAGQGAGGVVTWW